VTITPELYDTIVHIVDQRVSEIKVTREDFGKVAKAVSDLSVAVGELAEAQRRNEARLGSWLKRTELSLGERVISLESAIERLDRAVEARASAEAD